MIDNYDWDRLSGLYPAEFIEKMKGLDGKACWKGYKQVGTKQKGGKTVDNCVKISNHSEDETADFGPERIKKYLNRDHGENSINQMTPNSLPEEPGEGDEKNPEMGEGVPIRMPRMEVIKKAMNKNGQLAMRAEPNFSEFDSEEDNGAMIVNHLRVIREKTDILLGMLDGTDNLPPWCFVKIVNAGAGLASVADYLRFGAET
jgi:hypothetical protein